MAKITNKERIEIWEKKKAGKGVAELSREYGLDKSTVKYLFRLLDKHGPGILRQEKNRTYSKELKQEIINRVLQDGMSKVSTAIAYGLPNVRIISDWISSYKANGYVILKKKKGRPPMKTKETKAAKPYEEMTDAEKIAYLEERNRYLEAETEYLKKLHAVVQARKSRQPKKK